MHNLDGRDLPVTVDRTRDLGSYEGTVEASPDATLRLVTVVDGSGNRAVG